MKALKIKRRCGMELVKVKISKKAEVMDGDKNQASGAKANIELPAHLQEEARRYEELRFHEENGDLIIDLAATLKKGGVNPLTNLPRLAVGVLDDKIVEIKGIKGFENHEPFFYNSGVGNERHTETPLPFWSSYIPADAHGANSWSWACAFWIFFLAFNLITQKIFGVGAFDSVEKFLMGFGIAYLTYKILYRRHIICGSRCLIPIIPLEVLEVIKTKATPNRQLLVLFEPRWAKPRSNPLTTLYSLLSDPYILEKIPPIRPEESSLYRVLCGFNISPAEQKSLIKRLFW